MNGPLAPGATIGIIGGGQLGRMLAIAAARLGYRTAVLEPQAGCPAAQLANRQIAAAYDDPAALDEMARMADVVTYEFENVPVEAANRLAASVPVFPPPRALEVSQDRVVEKTFLNAHGISTAGFYPVDNDGDIAAALGKLGGRSVLKTRRLGYDGKGQRTIGVGEAGDCEGFYAEMGDVPLIIEELVAFEHEISVIAARGRDGSLVAYEPSRNVHREGILHSSTVPAGIPEKIADEARRASFALLEALDYVGVAGVEFFVAADGRVLANEFAPRVHNSGHWTEAACAVSQFEQHIRAIAGLPLGEPGRHSDCVMENLIGRDVERVGALLVDPNLVLHLYGKTETRPGRKMGHFTRVTPGP
jgi:5-(carboxyamino)imidazole ribonucleotide synthase